MAWFSVLCGTYQSPMFGKGIEHNTSLMEFFGSLTPAYALSFLIPIVCIIIHLYYLYPVFFDDNYEKENEIP